MKKVSDEELFSKNDFYYILFTSIYCKYTILKWENEGR